MRIFVSYRREDASGHAGRLADAFKSRYGRDHVFIDVDAIPLGSTFPDEIARAVTSCDVLIALIGRGWLSAPDPEGGRRLDDAGDYVRLEIETALASGVVVVPVSVQGARIPKPRELPETLAPMTRRNGFDLRDASWPDDVASLVRRLEGGEDPTDQWAANERWSLPSAARSGFDLIRRLPPLERETRPGLAALTGSVFSGFGIALYFRTLPDTLIGIVLAAPFLVAASLLPETQGQTDAATPWWAWAMWGVSAVVSGLYCILRAYSSNQRLEGAGRAAKPAAKQREAVLARRVRSLVSQGWRVESQTRFEAVVTRPLPNHMLHAILAVFSFGLWAPVWITLGIQGGEKRRAASVDEWGNLRMQRLEQQAAQPVPEPEPKSRPEPEPEAETEQESATDDDSRRASAGAEHARSAAGAQPRSRRRHLALTVGAGLLLVATVAFIALGGGDDDEPTGTRAEKSTTPSITPSAAADANGNVRTLLAMLPAFVREDCAPDQTGTDDQLAGVKCDRWGATLYYELYRDPLEARSSFAIVASIAREDARDHAKTCRDAEARKPFVGTWKKPGGPEAGQLVCTFDPPESDGIAERQWTVDGTPILAKALYVGDRQTATEGVRLAWREATR